MSEDDLDRRLRAAAASWAAATDADQPAVTPPFATVATYRPRRWLVAGAAGLTVAAVIAVVTRLPASPFAPNAASSLTTTESTLAPGTPSSPPGQTTNAASSDPCTLVASSNAATVLSIRDTVTSMWLCRFAPSRPPLAVRVPQEQLAALTAAVELPSIHPARCPLGALRWPVVVATLGGGKEALVSLPTDACAPRMEVLDTITHIPPFGCLNVLDTLDTSHAFALLPGARIVDSGASESGNDRRKEVVYAFRNGEVRVTAGCGLANMPVNLGAKLVNVHGEQWYWAAGVRRGEGTPSPDFIVWPVPKADAWIEVEAGDHGQRLFGGSEMSDFTSAISYAGRH